MDEDELDVPDCINRVRLRDEDAARALTEHLYPLVIKIIRSHLPRRGDEQDLAQDVFLKVFSRLDQYQGDVPLSHWVSRIALTTCLDRLRAQMRRPEWRMADLGETEAEILQSTLRIENEPQPGQALAARDLIEKLLDRLKPEDRLVITLLDLEEKSVAEIRDLTGWGESAVKVRAFRARRKMRQLIDLLEPENRNAKS
ncbi:MAG: sigma-70 family RNA polymerase sigma factor [Verrucomicrobiae bacterium]|jgi:RNA polymerase sigma factor (sigma-70 family)|nr:sigma-70 family RNA polymerase sigma factor [Verrucomicrobiae bacterium]